MRDTYIYMERDGRRDMEREAEVEIERERGEYSPVGGVLQNQGESYIKFIKFIATEAPRHEL